VGTELNDVATCSPRGHARAMTSQAKGTFEIQATREPPYDSADGVVIGRTKFDKQWSGDVEATSVVEMISAGTEVKGSAAYVAMERIRGKVHGKSGSFVVHHTGILDRGAPSLSIRIVPDSGTGELRGISGTIQIDIVEKKHFYTLDYALRPAP
jgi:hypothetical protein